MKRNIFIVDDIQQNLQVLASILTKAGLSISVAMNGEQAVQGIRKKLPDLILLDIAMPMMDGYQVCSILKDDPLTREIPVIFLTAKTENEDIIKGFKVGAVDYITKPFNSAELLARVNTHLELKLSKQIIQRQILDLQQLNETKDKFFSIIAHDLKNPFNHILGITEMILNNPHNSELETVMSQIAMLNKSADRGYALLENLLEWSRLQTGRINTDATHFSLSALLRENIELLEGLANQKNIVFIKKSKCQKKILADRNMTNMILRNLMTNAIKYSYPGSSIEIFCQHVTTGDQSDASGMIEISIKDYGVGMDDESKENLFRIDRNLSTEGTQQEKGTGLGLILCKEFIERNGGRIRVESKINRGSIFICTLKPSPFDEEDLPVKINQWKIDRQLRILIADDDLINQKILKTILRKYGIAVVCVDNGHQALEMMKLENFDVLILDIQMPELNGIDTAKAIAEKYGIKRPSLIALSAHSGSDYEQAMKQSNFDRFLSKPLQATKLIEVIAELINS